MLNSLFRPAFFGFCSLFFVFALMLLGLPALRVLLIEDLALD